MNDFTVGITSNLFRDYSNASDTEVRYRRERDEANAEISDLRRAWRERDDQNALRRSQTIAENQSFTNDQIRQTYVEMQEISRVAEAVLQFASSYGQI